MQTLLVQYNHLKGIEGNYYLNHMKSAAKNGPSDLNPSKNGESSETSLDMPNLKYVTHLEGYDPMQMRITPIRKASSEEITNMFNGHSKGYLQLKH